MPVFLTKSELVDRAGRWAAGEAFTEARLNEWIDEGLVQAGARVGNVGISPVYKYRCAHYRRILQILRLRRRGIRKREEILILLFVDGRGVAAHEARDALRKMAASLRKRLNAFFRSTRIDDTKSIPPKHRRSLIRSLGKPDDRFIRAGIIPSDDALIAAIRAARSPDSRSPVRVPNLMKDEELVANLAKIAFGGFLAPNSNEIKTEISRATDRQFEEAKLGVNLLRNSARKIITDDAAASTFANSLKQPEFAATLLFVILRIICQASQFDAPFKE